MNQPFVLISGLPGSGKTTLARQLAPALHLPVIDKDDILEHLFESKGTADAAWRRTLSRESDVLLVAEATASAGAILVSFWRQAGMPQDSGTPTQWLVDLSDRVVQVHCACDPETAAQRFFDRRVPALEEFDASFHPLLIVLCDMNRFLTAIFWLQYAEAYEK